MHKRTFVGLCAALAFVAGSPGAHALKIDDVAPTSRAEVEADMDSITYASETLLTTRVTDVTGDSTKYYNVGADAETLVLSLPGDVPASAGDTYLVSVALDGMVFRTALTNGSLAAAASTGTDATFEIAAGGAAKDKTVVFRKTPTGVVDGTSILTLTASFAVSSGGGSATVTLTNQTVAGLNIPNVSGMKTHGPANVIKVASALKETPKPNNLTASVDSSFKKFMGDMTVGHVGSLTIGFNTHRAAGGATPVDGLEDILVGGQTATDAANSSVSFMGDFSFTEKVFVHGDEDCGAPTTADPAVSSGSDTSLASAAADLRNMEGTGDDAVVTGTTKPVNIDATPSDATAVAEFMTYLCIMVQGDDTDDKAAPRIPDTDAYTAMGSYKALENAASGPMGMERELGQINRDGTTAHIPYLTTYEGYNQRIVLSNRGSADAGYEIEFRPEEGVMATGTDMAMGTLKGNSTVTMKATDLVTIEGGLRTAATIIVEAQSGNIDVTSVTVNRENGGTDTVVHHSE